MALWYNINTLNAYVDESGSVNLNDPNPYYLTAAVIMPESVVPANKVLLEQIASSFFSGNTIKSSNVGGDHERRFKVLQELVKLDFQFIFLLVNKKKLNPESGYRFKASFYKNLNKKLYQSLCRCGGFTLSLVCKTDQHGTSEFQNQVQKYMHTQMQGNLLYQFSMFFADDKSDRLIQLADFIAGTLTYCWIPEKESEYSAKFKALLQSHQLDYNIFPRNFKEISQLTSQATYEEIDEEIGNVLYNQAIEFIDHHENDDDQYQQMQAATLKILLEQYESNDDGHLYLEKIQALLEESGFERISRQLFISKIIGGLRFAGIIISGSNKGYCLALSLSAINDYLDHNATVIFPMLSRLKEARSRVSALINYDILWREKDTPFIGMLNSLQEIQMAEAISFDEEHTTLDKINMVIK